MKKLILIGSILIGLSIHAMERPAAVEEKATCQGFSIDKVEKFAEQAVERYNIVLKNRTSLQAREQAYEAFVAFVGDYLVVLANQLSYHIVMGGRADIPAYHLLYLCDGIKDRETIKTIAGAYFNVLCEPAREEIVRFLITLESPLAYHLVALLDIEQISACGYHLDDHEEQQISNEFTENMQQEIFTALNAQCQNVVHKDEPLVELGEIATIIRDRMNGYSRDNVQFMIDFENFMRQLPENEQFAYLTALVLQYGCATFAQAVQAEDVLLHFFDYEKSSVFDSDMLLQLYNSFLERYPQSALLADSYAKFCDPRVKMITVLSRLLASIQAKHIAYSFTNLGKEGYSEDVAMQHAHAIAIPEGIKVSVLINLLDLKNKELITQIHDKSKYCAAVMILMLPRFLSKEDFIDFLCDSNIIQWHTTMKVSKDFRTMLMRCLSCLVAADRLEMYTPIVDECMVSQMHD